MNDHAGQGKIQRASHALRMELNRRLFNGALGPELLPWLNEQEEIQHICAEHFDGESVTAKNLSDYRRGAYQKWLESTQQIERQKSLAAFALEMARASSGAISEAGAQLVAGQYLRALSAAADGDSVEPPDHKTAQAMVALRKADQEAQKMAQRDRLLAQKDRELDLREANAAFAVAAKVEAVVRTRMDELQAAVASSADPEERQRNIARVIYGDDLLERMERRRREAAGEELPS